MARRRFFRDAGPAKRTRVNEMIRISPVRLIDQDNKQVGVVETPEALRMAREADLDLVEIAGESRPPVCKIMDYGKYKYELSKKEQKNRAASKSTEMKEVRLGRSIKVDPHDIQIRVKQARKFLLEGHKVLLVQRFRGREMMHSDLGVDILRDVVNALDDVSRVETPPKTQGRRMTMILAPDKPKIEAYKRKQAKEQPKDEKKSQEAPPKKKSEEKREQAAKARAESQEGSEQPQEEPAGKSQ